VKDIINKIVAPKNYVKSLISLLIPALMMLIRPINMTMSQSAVLGGLFLVILWWGTGWVHKDVASTVLLLVFLIFGHMPAAQIFNFPLSENLIMIIAAYLLSAGIVNSKIAKKFSGFCIKRFCRNGRHLAALSFILSALLIFIIPQPFPRVVLMAAIYIDFLEKFEITKNEKSVLLFSIFAATTVTSLLFLNGDVTANYAALGFAGVSISYTEYIKYMLPPTVAASVLVLVIFRITFRKELVFSFVKAESGADSDSASVTGSSGKPSDPRLDKQGIKALVIMAVIIAMWLLEPVHHVSAAKVAAAGVILMFLFRVTGLNDLKTINISLIWFLTAEFAIGRTLIGSGVAEKIKDAILPFLPSIESFWFLPVIVLIIMLLHMIMGSLITALSFGIPLVIVLTNGYWPHEFSALLVLAVSAFHYVMPFHHVTVMIGYGSGYYENRHTLKFGILLTPLVMLLVIFCYLPWWKLMGVAP
jgi:di/tricarboxylate transporter